MKLGLLTPSGGKISIHFGSVCTTNLWNGAWYVIDDKLVIERLKQIERSSDPDGLAATLQREYNVDEIGHPFRRRRETAKPAEPFTMESILEPIETVSPEDSEAPGAPGPHMVDTTAEDRKDVAQKIMEFFSEFTFKPAARFVNTLSRQASYPAAKAYVCGYMALCNHPDANAINDKLSSAEFKSIFAKLQECKSDKVINNRFEVFYGDPGVGKTHKAVSLYSEAEVIVCNSNMLPDDLMRTFDFNDDNGNPVFKPSALQIALTDGKPIILDEINLLNFDSIRFAQGILDNKDSFNYNGTTLSIAPGFKVIGTMNLEVNGQIYNLSDPLVDRAGHIEKIEITAEQLAEYSF